MMKSIFEKEVENKLIALAKNKSAEDALKLQTYHGSQLPHLGLSIPEGRAAFKSGYSFSTSPISEQLKIWDTIWKNSHCFEVMEQAIYFCHLLCKKQYLVESWDTVKIWIDRVDNWDQCDGLSSFYSYILESKPMKVYPTLKKWNKSSHPWKRRASILSLLYYSSTKNSVLPFNKVLPLIKNLLCDEHYFVQKAIGWALRELGQVYPKETWKFLLINIKKLSTTAYPAAISKLNNEQKTKLKTIQRSQS